MYNVHAKNAKNFAKFQNINYILPDLWIKKISHVFLLSGEFFVMHDKNGFHNSHYGKK